MSRVSRGRGVPQGVACWLAVPAGFGDRLGRLCAVWPWAGDLGETACCSGPEPEAGASTLTLLFASSVALDILLTSVCLSFYICKQQHLSRKAVAGVVSQRDDGFDMLAQGLCRASPLHLSPDHGDNSIPRQSRKCPHRAPSAVPGRVGTQSWKPLQFKLFVSTLGPWGLALQSGGVWTTSWLASEPRRNCAVSLRGV